VWQARVDVWRSIGREKRPKRSRGVRKKTGKRDQRGPEVKEKKAKQLGPPPNS
jgi:hypothetical protein